MGNSNRERRRSPSQARNDYHTNNGSSSNTLIISAMNTAATALPSPVAFPIQVDNSYPASYSRIINAYDSPSRVNGLASPRIPSASTHDSDNAMPDVQGDKPAPTQNRTATSFIPFRNSSHPHDFPDSLRTVATHVTHGEQIESNATEDQQEKENSCGCFSPGYILENFQKNHLMYQNQIKDLDKLIDKVIDEMIDEATSSSTIPADILLPMIYRMEEAQEVRERLAHVEKHLQQIKVCERAARAHPLPTIACETVSTVYEIPESFGSRVLKFGPRETITQERQNSILVSQALEKMGPSIKDTLPLSRRRYLPDGQSWPRKLDEPSRLGPLQSPKIQEHVPTGFQKDGDTGLVRLCASLDPRILHCRDTDGDPKDQVGIVMSRIGYLDDPTLDVYFRRCKGLKDDKLDAALRENQHCFIRIYLGKRSDEDGPDDEPASNVNLPGYLDYIKACEDESLVGEMAQRIAIGYAVLHWGADLDATGVEFVLGLSPTGHGVRPYMRNFADCRPIKHLTAEGVRGQLVPAALENGPYIPRYAYRSVNNLANGWLDFECAYREVSGMILNAYGRQSERNLPGIFIDQLKNSFPQQQGAERFANQSLDSEAAEPNQAVHGDDDNSQSQAGREIADDDHTGDEGRDADATEIGGLYDADSKDLEDSSEEEEVSDEDENQLEGDDDDDVD